MSALRLPAAGVVDVLQTSVAVGLLQLLHELVIKRAALARAWSYYFNQCKYHCKNLKWMFKWAATKFEISATATTNPKKTKTKKTATRWCITTTTQKKTRTRRFVLSVRPNKPKPDQSKKWKAKSLAINIFLKINLATNNVAFNVVFLFWGKFSHSKENPVWSVQSWDFFLVLNSHLFATRKKKGGD